jgi:hypothetical protein
MKQENPMIAETVKKCAHPNCSCPAREGGYCSIECEAMAKTPDIECTCRHPACKGEIDTP